MKERRLSNWLAGIGDLTERTEAPEHFWLWAGISTLCSALQRKVWVPYGLDKIRPNLYIILVAPPGKCRKGGPVALSKRLLQTIGCTVSVDSTSKESLTMELANAVITVDIPDQGPTAHSPMAVISKELSSLLAVDAKKMIECLTDLYDDHEVWEYKTKHGKPNKIYGPCVSVFAATTPYYIANNLPYEAFGAGFFSRVVFVVGDDKKCRIPIPEITDRALSILKDLEHDLNIISHLRGEFRWSGEGRDLFENWYYKLDSKYREVKDDRFHGFIERAHVQVLKAAMAIGVSESSNLEFGGDDIGRAIDLIEGIFPDLSKAFGGLGRSDLSLPMHQIREQMMIIQEITFSQLFAENWRNFSPDEFGATIRALTTIGEIEITADRNSRGGYEQRLTWKGGEK